MSTGEQSGHRDEPSLIRLYMELTVCSESEARSTWMYLCARRGFDHDLPDDKKLQTESPQIERQPNTRELAAAGKRLERAPAISIPNLAPLVR